MFHLFFQTKVKSKENNSLVENNEISDNAEITEFFLKLLS